MRGPFARLALAAALAALSATPVAAAATTADPATRPFPARFAWGVATSGFQTEAGGRPVNADRGSDWWVWTHDPQNLAAHRVTADRVEDGPGDWHRAVFRRDVALARGLHARVFRLGIEWSRIFPRSTEGVRLSARPRRAQLRRLDALADRGALRHYAAMLREVRRAGLEPFVTVDHFTLPSWLHDPIATRDALTGRDPDADLPAFTRPAGWLQARSVGEFRKYAAYLAWKLGGLVTYWTPLNEPMVVAVSGYVNVPGVVAQNFPPGAFSFTGALAALEHQAQANAAAYDVIHRLDRRARVGLVHNMIAFTPEDPGSPLDRRGAEHADALFNRRWLDAAAGKADFVGVNFYFRGRVKGLPVALSRRIPELDFVPSTSYATATSPLAAPCPTTCSDFGNELYPEGLAGVLREAGSYGKPLYVTENGIADADDDQRPGYLVRQLAVLRRAMAGGADVRGWFHWSLVDNFEWSSGYAPRFGLYAYDQRTLRRAARPSAALVRRIMGRDRIPASVLRRYPS